MVEIPYRRSDASVAFLAGVAVGVSPIIALLPSWADMTTPAFIGLVLGVVGGVTGAVFVRPKVWHRIKGETSSGGAE